MNFYRKSTNFLKIAVLSSSVIVVGACNLHGSGRKAVNEVAKATKSCGSFKTDSQADGENLVTRQGLPDYKFNLYYFGDSKIDVWENNGVDDKYSASFKPVVIHVLDKDNHETETVNCAENKINAAKCITRFEKIVVMVNEARKSAKDRGAAVSEGKEFTFKCTQEFANQKVADLKRI